MVDRDWFFTAYDGVPPWDIGRPQKAIIELAQTGEISGSVLDIGCGTGENALHLSGLGYRVTGVDMVEKALEKAREKALQRHLTATFRRADALELDELGQTFDCLIDCGLFHTLADQQRPWYVESLARVAHPGTRLHLLCFSEHEPGEVGPRRVRQTEIRQTFEPAWKVLRIQALRFESKLHAEGARGWLACLERA